MALKLKSSSSETDSNVKELKRKAILLIDFLDRKSKTFSIARMNLRNALEK